MTVSSRSISLCSAPGTSTTWTLVREDDIHCLAYDKLAYGTVPSPVFASPDGVSYPMPPWTRRPAGFEADTCLDNESAAGSSFTPPALLPFKYRETSVFRF
eukprot:CAMPEP_0119134788 /NCGR_PEP_ID=MMETSP1310-20130426/17862_1 /TAXON_ID=464262 /ORGANISM="Genus nov. species nov., Strain RCC2339" /LENGTH=100 /DNA_ID=CAMNT_0007125619 /DNA_START=197 /DNA_END=496 /DNA_ORIENTATION=-